MGNLKDLRTKIGRVYGKLKTDKRFKPFNMQQNKFEVNLIKIDVFYPNQFLELEKEVEEMNKINEKYEFEVRYTK